METAPGLERLLRQNEAAPELQVYEGVGHMFDDGKGGIDWPAALAPERRATVFLQKHLKRPDSRGEPSR